MNCADCGKPVHPYTFCDECGVETFYHDSTVDFWLCLGAGPHVKGVTS